ncbi:MAG TPA: Hsp20/alpha crystallin family protein [Acidimicrobiales bacterium]|jgi:HSP20 family protein|nr:Hsp20/alpha crystallin family protein [Acidimicrobiales bacterium]
MNEKPERKQDREQSRSPARRESVTPWLTDWFDFPELSRWFDTRPAFFHGMDRMRIEEEQQGDELVVRAELPGIDPEKDVDLTVDRGALRIRAERRSEQREEREGRTHSEFHYGMLSRTIPLPQDVDADKIKATYKDGILEVHVPVARTAADTRKVAVRRG